MSKPRLVVVSYTGRDPYTPRGTRTQALIERLAGDWSIELYASSASLRTTPPSRALVRSVRKALRSLSERILLDKQEGWSRMQFQNWDPKADAALLIGFPMSPLVYASSCLTAHQTPYVIDVGDPWTLTHPEPRLRWPASHRAASAERRLWSGASGAIVTTDAQAEAILSLYPAVPVLVRPNGYDSAQWAASQRLRHSCTRSPQTLRLIHFGDLYSVRLDVGALLRRLVDSGRWQKVIFTQYGSDWSGALEAVPAQVRIMTHQPVPWHEAIAISRDHDVAVVIGNQNTSQLPSKAVQYLTLPIPRFAFTTGRDDDALMHYVADKPGWLAVSIDDSQLAARVHAHTSRCWSATELNPPSGEAWPRVADEIGEFIRWVLSIQGSGYSVTHQPSTRAFPPAGTSDV